MSTISIFGSSSHDPDPEGVMEMLRISLVTAEVNASDKESQAYINMLSIVMFNLH